MVGFCFQDTECREDTHSYSDKDVEASFQHFTDASGGTVWCMWHPCFCPLSEIDLDIQLCHRWKVDTFVVNQFGHCLALVTI